LTFELRIAIDLATHWMAAGRRSKAVRLLTPIYQKFTEGFETQDLVAAQRLLQRARADE
jgi:predicted ATPase